MVTALAITSDIGAGDATEVGNAQVAAKEMAKSINRYWNNGGRGWTVELQDGSEYTLLFTPEIRAVSENVFSKDVHGFEEFDRMHYTSMKGPSYVRPVEGWTVANNYPAEYAAPERRRGVPRRPWQTHSGEIREDDAGPDQTKWGSWNLGHEYGHLLGLIDRYSGDATPDQGYATKIMGKRGNAADGETIMEFLALSGVNVRSVRPRTQGAVWKSRWETAADPTEGVPTLVWTEKDWGALGPHTANDKTQDVLKPTNGWTDMMVVPRR